MLRALLLACVATQAIASPCDQFFPNGREIPVPNTTVLCNSFYATVYDQVDEAALFSTEIGQGAGHATRSNNFHADSRLAKSPSPADYDGTGYDRGHLTPAADANSAAEMSDTFLMSNMTPQLPSVNRISWKQLESKVRAEPFKWVVTGAVYRFPAKVIGRDHVPVPLSYYKLVWLADGTVQAFIADNSVGAPVTASTLTAVEQETGVLFH